MSLLDTLFYGVAVVAGLFALLAIVAPNALQTILRPMFGSFEKEEFKKFLRMGLIFAFVIGSYWTMRALKDTCLMSLVGGAWAIPFAKTASLIMLLPLVMFYSKMLDKMSREKMFYTLAAFYGVALAGFALLMISPIGQAPCDVIAMRDPIIRYLTYFLGFTWYVFVESFGSLVVALFWAFSSDITLPDSAKKGFPLIVAIGQIGGIVGPKVITNYIPGWLNLSTNSLSIFICSITVLSLILLMRYFLKSTPKELLTSFKTHDQATVEKSTEAEHEPGFLEGLKLLVKHNYLLSIFLVVSFFEVIVTVFDFHFKLMASQQFTDTVALGRFLGDYSSLVNTVSLICLLLGVSNIMRVLGVGVALALMPIIMGGALLGFVTFNNLQFLFWLMVCSKAINYALNGPALKQLYIPTSHDARFKSQAWIETFGSRGAKEAGSLFNMLLKPFQGWWGPVLGQLRHVWFSFYAGIGIVIVWFFSALYLGKTYKKAVDEKKIVC